MIVEDKPPELAIYLILALIFLRFGRIVAPVKLPAPTIPTTPFFP
jgi:hypothetical protein